MSDRLITNANPFRWLAYGIAATITAVLSSFTSPNNLIARPFFKLSHLLHSAVTPVYDAPALNMELTYKLKGVAKSYKLPNKKAHESLDAVYYTPDPAKPEIRYSFIDVAYARKVDFEMRSTGRETADWVKERLKYQDQVSRLNQEFYKQLEQLNPELQALVFDREDALACGHVISGIASRYNISDIQYYLDIGCSGRNNCPEVKNAYAAIKRVTGHMGWVPSPETLTSIAQQLKIKIPDLSRYMRKNLMARNEPAVEEVALETEEMTTYRDMLRDRELGLIAEPAGRQIGGDNSRKINLTKRKQQE